MPKTHLGDNLYAEYTDNHEIRLTIEWSAGPVPINSITLTPDQLVKLGEFALREAKNHAN